MNRVLLPSPCPKKHGERLSGSVSGTESWTETETGTETGGFPTTFLLSGSR